MSARQSNGELREIADLAVDRNRAAMLLGHDVVADRQAKAGPLASRLGREEWLKELVPDLWGNAGAVVAHVHLDRIAKISRRHLQSWVELLAAALPLAFGGGVEAIADQVQTAPSDILGY